MFLSHLVVALSVAVIISIVLWLSLRRIGPWPNFWAYFFILFLAVWAGGIWIAPVGPALWGVYWIPFFVIGVALALLFVALGPRRKPRNRREAIRYAEQQRGALITFSLFFWSMVVLFSLAILARYAT